MIDEQPTPIAVTAAGPGSSARGWSTLQRRLHWASAALVAVQGASAFGMPKASERLAAAPPVAPGAADVLLVTAHTFSGIAIGLLLVWRLRLRHERRGLAPHRAWAVRLVHGGLYASVSLMVLSGSLHWYVGIEAAARWHELGKWALVTLLAVHLLGALRHGMKLLGGSGSRDSR